MSSQAKEFYRIQQHRPITFNRINKSKKSAKKAIIWHEHLKHGEISCRYGNKFERFYYQRINCDACPFACIIGKRRNRIWCKDLRIVIGIQLTPNYGHKFWYFRKWYEECYHK